MRLTENEAFGMAQRLGKDLLVAYNVPLFEGDRIPRIEPGQHWVAYTWRPSNTDVDLILNYHHGFTVSRFQFPLFSVLQRLLMEADEMFRAESVRTYFAISEEEIDSCRDVCVRVLGGHLLDTLARAQDVFLPSVIEQAVVSISNTVGKQQSEINWRVKRIDPPKSWVFQQPDLRAAFVKFPDVPFHLLKFIDTRIRPEKAFQERLRKGGKALFDERYLVEDYHNVHVAYRHLKSVYKRALRMFERLDARDSRENFERKWSAWARTKYNHLPVSDLCRDLSPSKLAHEHLAALHERSPKYLEELMRKLRKKVTP